ncbi:MAG: hypothetical protein ACXABY_32995, partial [Candidatus Thorarchaeota archaeon]
MAERKTFGEIVDLHKKFQEVNPAAFGNTTVEEFSQQAQEFGGGDDYSAGLDDTLLKRGSLVVDKALDATGVREAGKSAFGSLGKAIGFEEVGKQVGEELPRQAGQTAIAGIGTSMLLAPEPVSSVIGAGLLGLSGLGFFSKTKEQGGSTGEALIDTALGVGAPAIGRAARGAAGQFMSSRVGGKVAKSKLTGEILKDEGG